MHLLVSDTASNSFVLIRHFYPTYSLVNMQHYDILAMAGLRIDGRRPDDIRNMKHNFGLVKSADGSAYLEQGLNKVLALVHGPQEPKKKSNDQSDGKCNVVCNLVTAPFSGTERKTKKMGDRRVLETERIMKQVVDEIVMLEIYPRSEINIVVHVLESDGSLICCIINAISLALMEAGIAMSDIVVACSAGFVQKELCVDLTLVEQNAGGAYLPIVMKARSEEIVHMQLDCRLSLDLLDEAMQKSLVGCRQVKTYIEAAIRKRMASIAEVVR